jgi:hypothetical protein
MRKERIQNYINSDKIVYTHTTGAGEYPALTLPKRLYAI